MRALSLITIGFSLFLIAGEARADDDADAPAPAPAPVPVPIPAPAPANPQTNTSAPDALTDATPPVPVYIDIDEDIRVVGDDGVDKSCSTACVLHLVPGWYDVRTKTASQKIFFDRGSRVSLVRGDHNIATLSTVALLAGAAIAIAAIVLPIAFCRTGTQTVDQYGALHPEPNSCDKISDGFKVAWIAGGGVGLTLAIVGGISLVFSGPRLSTHDWREASTALRLRF
jgi:hypothetical protein